MIYVDGIAILIDWHFVRWYCQDVMTIDEVLEEQVVIHSSESDVQIGQQAGDTIHTWTYDGGFVETLIIRDSQILTYSIEK